MSFEENMGKMFKVQKEAIKETINMLQQSSVDNFYIKDMTIDSSIENANLNIYVTLIPIHALRCIEIELPYWFKFRSCRKISRRFEAKKVSCTFTSSKPQYDFPFNDGYFKDHFNHSKYVFK